MLCGLIILKNVSGVILKYQDNKTIKPPFYCLNFQKVNIMILETQIQNKLKNVSQTKILMSMGYLNIEKAQERLELFNRVNNIYLWLKLETYDSIYDGEGFVKELLKVLELYTEDSKNILREHKRKLYQMSQMEQPYIDIDTKFQRGNESIHDLVKARHQKRIMLSKEDTAFTSPQENLNFVQQIIKEHHIRTNGDLGIWGKVYYYYYKASDGNIYGFDKYGERL